MYFLRRLENRVGFIRLKDCLTYLDIPINNGHSFFFFGQPNLEIIA